MDYKKIKITELWGISSVFKCFVKISSDSEVESSEAHRLLRKQHYYLISQLFIQKL